MKVGKKTFIGLLFIFGLFLIAAARPQITGKAGAIETEKNDLNGRIFTAEYKPDQPKIFERITATIVAENNGKEKNNYLLEIKITKNGQLKYDNDFTFSLLPDETVSFSPSYTPDEIGEFNVLVRLYDKKGEKIYDEEILNFVVQSDVGPFDLEVDLPSHMVGVGDSLPATISIKNVGKYGTDIELGIDIYCVDGEKTSKTMYIFVNASSDVKKQVFLETCAGVGQQTLLTSLNLYGKELLSSKTQFYINATMPKVSMKTQNQIKANSGEKTTFGIEIMNPNDFDLMAIKPFIYGIPPDWLVIQPSSFSILKSNESAVFAATIDVPEDVETKSYDIVVGIGGNNVFSKNEAMLSVTGAAAKPALPAFLSYQLISSYWVQIALVFAALSVILLSYVFLERRKLRKQWEKKLEKEIPEEFEKLKEKWKKK